MTLLPERMSPPHLNVLVKDDVSDKPRGRIRRIATVHPSFMFRKG